MATRLKVETLTETPGGTKKETGMEEEWTDVTDGALIKTAEQRGKEPKAEKSQSAFNFTHWKKKKYCGPALEQ